MIESMLQVSRALTRRNHVVSTRLSAVKIKVTADGAEVSVRGVGHF